MALISQLVVVLVTVGVVFAQPIPYPEFNCPSLPTPPPATNVTKLKPGNIKVIMALGDSMSAGFAMQGFPPEDLMEWRQYVWSIGGAVDAFSLATMLQNYSPGIQGAAQDTTWPLTKGAWLDGGVSHASIENVPDQITYLVNALKTQYANTVDFNNDWKLLTLFIGANNLCSACNNQSQHAKPEFFRQQLIAVMDQIHEQIPKVFVNVMTIFNISGVWTAGQKSWYCRMLWDGITNHECGCLLTGKPEDRLAMDIHAQEFNKITNEIVDQYAALNDPHFTAVVQPGVQDLPVGEIGEEFLSALDCFHPNLYANWAFAYQVWNNMFQPKGQKSTAPNMNDLQIYCPTAADYIQ